MSYILDALRKSEIERKQGEVPDLGASMQIIHKPRRTPSSALVWLVLLVLLVNGGLLGWVFWPKSRSVEVAAPAASAPVTVKAPTPAERPRVKAEMNEFDQVATSPVPPVTAQPGVPVAVQPSVTVMEEPAISAAPEARIPEADNTAAAKSSVPSLGSMPADFQRQVPDLTFNSHIYSSKAEARRIMINDQYLKQGGRFQGMTVEEITEDGVVLSLQGQSFLVGVVRNWNAPR